MENMNDDVKDILERLKEQAESTAADSEVNTQTTDAVSHTADDITDMLKKQFSAEHTELSQSTEDYSFDTDDFVLTGEINVSAMEEEKDIAPTVEEVPADSLEDDKKITEEIIEENTYSEEAPDMDEEIFTLLNT